MDARPIPQTPVKAPARRARRARRGLFRDPRAGATSVEMAFIALPFFLLLFAMIEIGAVFFAGTVMENAVLEIGREIRTGQMQASGTGEDYFREQVCDRIEVIGDCDRLSFDVRVFDSFGSVDQGSPIIDGEIDPSSFGFDPGQAGDIVLVRVFYEWPLLTPNVSGNMANLNENKRLLTAATVFRNEPFEDD